MRAGLRAGLRAWLRAPVVTVAQMTSLDAQLRHHVTAIAATPDAYQRWIRIHPALGLLAGDAGAVRAAILHAPAQPARADQVTRILLDLAHDGDQDAGLALLEVLGRVADRYPWGPQRHRYGPLDNAAAGDRRAELYGDLALTIANTRDHHRLDRLPVRLVSRAAAAFRRRTRPVHGQTKQAREVVTDPTTLIRLDRRREDGADGPATDRAALAEWRAAITRAVNAGQLPPHIWDRLVTYRLAPALGTRQRATHSRGYRAALAVRHLTTAKLTVP